MPAIAPSLDDYAAWSRKITPEELKHQRIDCFEPMWTYRDHAAIAEAARWLFNDPQSHWVPLLRPQGRQLQFFPYGHLFASPLVAVAGFREGLIAAMAVKAPMGTVHRGDFGSIVLKMNDGGGLGEPSLRADLSEVKPGENLPFRVCDFLAWRLSTIEGAPGCELYWPEDRRDRAVAACTSFLKRYGDRFTADRPRGARHPRPEGPSGVPRPGPVRDPRRRPRGPGDLLARRAGRGPGREGARAAHPGALGRVQGFADRSLLQRRHRAPRIRSGRLDLAGRGGPQGGPLGTVLRFRPPAGDGPRPAAEIELRNAIGRNWGLLSSGLDVQLVAPDPLDDRYEPGRPISALVKIRNRRGIENTAPTEFLRRGDDGRPALRRGVALAVFYSPPALSRSARGIPQDELKPRRTDRFEPGAVTRPLEPFEEFEAMRLDLNDWFDLGKPGSYRVRIAFAADSGVGEGNSLDWYFTVGDREDAAP